MELTNLPNSYETITLNKQTNYRLSEIIKIKDYFDQEIKYQQLLTNRLSKYITCFDRQNSNCFFSVFSGKNLFAHAKTKRDC